MEKNESVFVPGRKLSLSASIRKRQQEGWFPVISEIKVRSDKEGDLLRGRDPVALAREMAQRPVAGISVVTERFHFGGQMGLLRAVAAAVDLPVLHKDFITTERQIEESATGGSSAVLLIAAVNQPLLLSTSGSVGTSRRMGLKPSAPLRCGTRPVMNASRQGWQIGAVT